MELREPAGQLQLSLGINRRIFGVSEINSEIQKLFAGSFSAIQVAGEISGCRAAASGHYYFCLKDTVSQLRCVLFKNAARLSRLRPQDGMAVLIHGNLEVYQARGEYQLLVDRLELYGSGSLQVAFEQLKDRLAAEGLFSKERKRALPRHPRRIGLITSLGGAVLHDILQILARRFPGLSIRIYPAQVQGEGAVEQLCTAVSYFSRTVWADVVILARGGGSLEDLWCFNDERLARAIANSNLPIISAVGHETDFTIADFVADYRAPTPSAGAEVVICTRESLLMQLSEQSTRLLRIIRFRLVSLSRDIDVRSRDRGVSLIRRVVSRHLQRVDESDYELRRMVSRRLEALRRELRGMAQRLQEANLPLRFSRNRHRQELLALSLTKSWRAAYWIYRQRLDRATSQIVQLSPLGVLARGYAIVEKTSGAILRDASQTTTEEEVNIRLHAGHLKATVTEVLSK